MPEYYRAYTPDPEKLAALHPSDGPLSPVFGASAVRDRQQAAYDIYRGDLMNELDDMVRDPRATYIDWSGEVRGTTALEGYVTNEMLEHDKEDAALIDTHYGRLLPEEFYARYGFAPGTPLSTILRNAIARDNGGNFTMPKMQYIDLLADIGKVHAQEAAKFTERAEQYRRMFANGLRTYGLDDVLQKFEQKETVTPIRIDDGFDTLLHRGALGLYHHGKDEVVIAPQEDEYSTVVHELTHTLEGNGFDITFTNHPWLVKGLKEGTADQFEMRLTYGGDMQNMSIGGQAAEHPYEVYRAALDMLCNGGREQIAVHDFIATDIAELVEPNQELLDKIASSFPDHPDMLSQLDGLMKNMHVTKDIHTSNYDMGKAQDLLVYTAEVREHYAPKPERGKAKVSRMRQLVGRIGMLAGRRN